MPANIQLWPRVLNRSVGSSFTLGSLNGMDQPLMESAPAPFAEPFDRRWFATITSPAMGELETARGARKFPSWREVEGRIAWLKGTYGRVRLFDPDNFQPAYNFAHAADAAWSGGASWANGRRWLAGGLPPYVTVDEPAAEGAESIVVRNLPANAKKVFTWGDRMECRPAGQPLDYGAYHMVGGVSNSNSAGKTRVYIGPGLRVGLNVGDMIVLKYPTSVFRMLDDKQGVVQRTNIRTGSFGWSLVEALRAME